jgi:hypothetical protein
MQVHGTLLGRELAHSEKARHVLSVDQLLDYANNRAYEVGSQAFGLGLRSRWRLGEKIGLETLLQPNLTVLSGISSEYAGFTGRSYDYGSGVGLQLAASLTRNLLPIATLAYRGFYQHTMNGAAGNQVVHFAYAMVAYPVWRSLGARAEYLLYMRDSFYSDLPDIHRRNPEFRIGAALFWNRR